MTYSRFAVYFVPPEGALASFGVAWLGWDIARGKPAAQLEIPGLSDVTETPRKYGFHGTLKPPFRLAQEAALGDLQDALTDLSRTCNAATCDGLHVVALGRFLALIPKGDASQINDVAALCVTKLDHLRAPLTDVELEKRNHKALSPRKQALLQKWGYPHVLDQFRFHMTLTGRLPKADVPLWTQTAQAQMPVLQAPFELRDIALCGERGDGHFELIKRYPLMR